MTRATFAATPETASAREVVTAVAELPVAAAAPALELAVIDGLRRGRPGLLERLIRAYLTYSPEAVEGLKAAAAAGDIEAVGMAAHSLKSSSASMGAAHLASIFKVLEQRAAAGDAQAVGALVEEAVGEFERVRAVLEGLNRAPSDPGMVARG